MMSHSTTPFPFVGAVILSAALLNTSYGQQTRPQSESYQLTNKDKKLTTVTPSVAPPPPGTIPSDQNPAVDIGVGYDSMSDEVRPRCIAETERELPAPNSQGQNGKMLLTYVTSEDDISRSLGISANASFGMGLFSADASVQYLSSSQMNQYSSYLLVTSSNENGTQLLPRYTLTSAAKTALRQGLPQFIRLCGDQFVRGRITGGSISAILKASSSTEKEQIDASATLHAAGWGGSLDASAQQKLQSYETAGRLDMQILRKGPAESWPHQNVADLIDYAQTFPSKVAAASPSAWIISYILSPYDEIYQQWTAPQPQVDFFEREGPYLRALYQTRNDYTYIQANPDQFGTTSSIKLQNATSSLANEIDRVQHAATTCLSDQNQCGTLTHLPIVSSVAQRASEWQNLDPTINSYRTYYTVVAPDQKVLEFRGQFWTQCQNHGAGVFGPTQWAVQFVNTKSGAVEYDGQYPNHPVRVPPDSQVNIHVIDSVPGDNCAVDGSPPQARLFTPVFSDDY